MKRVLIMDLGATGHHPRYIRWILGCDACRGAEIILAGRSELFDHAELRDIAGRFQRHTVCLSVKRERNLSDMSSELALMRKALTVWKIWREAYEQVIRAAPVDVVVIPYADDIIYAIALTGSPFKASPWTGIAFGPRFHFRRMGMSSPQPRFSAVRSWLFRRALHDQGLTSLFTIDPTLYEYANSYLRGCERNKLVFLPDPAVDHTLPSLASARGSLGIPLAAKVLLIYGALSERKGVSTLVECANSSKCPSNIYVLLAGKQSPGISAFLAGPASLALKRQNRLKSFNRYVSDSEEACLLAATDCMWVGYREFYTMSAVLVLAARHGIPCIVSEHGISEYMVRKHKFGLIIDPENWETVLTALREVSGGSRNLVAQGRRGALAFSRHSISEFQNTISKVIENALDGGQHSQRNRQIEFDSTLTGTGDREEAKRS
jgi:glycosyltransferase involved in cell wall biosynthesis